MMHSYVFKVFGNDFFTSDNHFQIVSCSESKIVLKSEYDKFRFIEITGKIENYKRGRFNTNGSLMSITIAGWYYNPNKSKLDMVTSAVTSFYIPVIDDSLIPMAHIKMIDCYKDILMAFQKKEV